MRQSTIAPVSGDNRTVGHARKRGGAQRRVIRTIEALDPRGSEPVGEGVRVGSFGASDVPPERMELHRHPYYEVFWISSGGGVHLSDFKQYRFGAGTLVFTAMGQVHGWRMKPGTRAHVVAFTPDFLDLSGEHPGGVAALPIFSQLRERPTLRVTGAAQGVIGRLVRSLALEFEARHPFRVESLRAWLRLLLIECLRLHPTLQASGVGPQAQMTQRFLLLLEKSFRTVRRVEDYATRLKVGPTQLVAWVRARTGYTPGELMDRRVCMEARRLLAFTSATAAEIGYDLGFKDPAHFGRFFKRHSGMSPGEARRRAARTVQNSPG